MERYKIIQFDYRLDISETCGTCGDFWQASFGMDNSPLHCNIDQILRANQVTVQSLRSAEQLGSSATKIEMGVISYFMLLYYIIFSCSSDLQAICPIQW